MFFSEILSAIIAEVQNLINAFSNIISTVSSSVSSFLSVPGFLPSVYSWFPSRIRAVTLACVVLPVFVWLIRRAVGKVD